MDAFIQNFFNLAILKEMYPFLLDGLWMTVKLCLVVVPLGTLAGAVVAVLYSFRLRLLNVLLIVYVDFFRSFPPLVLLIFIYSGLPFAGVSISPFAAVCLGFLLNNSAYYAEIYRAGIESIGVGQMEAARSTGLNSFQAMLHVVLPQAIRTVLPDLLSNTIEVVKLTSIASVVALPELLYSADMARSITYNASPIVLASVLYLLLLSLPWLVSDG